MEAYNLLSNYCIVAKYAELNIKISYLKTIEFVENHGYKKMRIKPIMISLENPVQYP